MQLAYAALQPKTSLFSAFLFRFFAWDTSKSDVNSKGSPPHAAVILPVASLYLRLLNTYHFKPLHPGNSQLAKMTAGNASSGIVDGASPHKIDGQTSPAMSGIMPPFHSSRRGDQSSGKSSVLKGLTELPFPRDSNLCTRFLTQVVSRRSPESEISASIIRDVNTGWIEFPAGMLLNPSPWYRRFYRYSHPIRKRRLLT